ncbi:breast carcinoma-amplified sequence 1 isoform X4 [Takifugu rubripes]|uniref:breast carcinoma-amplified sequence 1 isoform X4 n=1 Tax=Takifugu rubripes TaxID=31033 RepID=UPI0011456752|nr:uncharacterized protein LOC105416303 isoform X4 [Takifugu rubripes]
MGNEQSVSEEPTQTEKIPETHENGSVNGLSAGVLAPASEISVTVEPTVEKNGGPLLLSLAVEPNGIGQVTDGGDGEHEGEHRGEHEEEHVDAAVVNEAIEKVVEEVKKSKEEKVSRFGKLFKMKPHVKNVPKEESPGESPAGASTPEEEPQQESSSSGDDTTSLRTLAGERTGSKLVMMEPEEEEEEEALSQSVVATEEPTENQRIPAEEELFMNDEYQNIFFSGGMDMDEGVPETEDDIVASLTSTDQEEVSVPLMSADSRGGPGLTRPGRSECIPVITRAEAGSAAAKADPVNTPEAAIEAFFQLLGDFAFPEPAVDAEILLEDEAVVAATSEATSEKLKLPTAERRRGEGPGTVGGEAADAWVEEPEGAEAQSFVEGHFERDFETIEDTASGDARRHVTSEQEAPDLSRDSKVIKSSGQCARTVTVIDSNL